MPLQQADLLSLLPVAILLLCILALVLLIEYYKRRAARRGQGQRHGQAQESPIEERFRLTWQRLYPHVPLIPQYGIGRYRVDFASLDAHVVVELDGQAYHSSPEQKAYDASRYMEKNLSRLSRSYPW